MQSPFVHGGVLFDVPKGLALPEELRRFCAADRGRAIARVHCEVKEAPELDGARVVDAHWRGNEADVTAGPMRARLCELSDGRYEAMATMAPTSLGAQALLSALSAVVLERRGGSILHAAGLELDGGVWLFVGPSGAGKSTAVKQCAAGRSFCADRAAITADSPARVWALPGGHRPAGAIDSTEVELPLLGVLRVRRASDASRVTAADSPTALRILRESVFRSSAAGASGLAASEGALLTQLATLTESVFVGFADVLLGEDLSPLLRSARRSPR